MNAKNGILYLLMFLQVGTAVLALLYGDFLYKSGSAGIGALILLLLISGRKFATPDVWMVIGAFALSIVGDYFLSHREGDTLWFVYGIGFFLLAHIGYLSYSLFHGKVALLFTGLLCAGYLIFFFTSLYDGIGGGILMWAALAYLFISCFSLGAAWGITLEGFPKWGYVFGIFLVLFSDTLIAITEFMGNDRWEFLILPTYYMAHIVITWSVSQRFRAAIAIG
jgi:uncharacterized membrane protein YhhN